MTANDLKQFLDSRPAINRSAFARECGIDPSRFHRIVEGTRPMHEWDHFRIIHNAYEYGYEPNQHNYSDTAREALTLLRELADLQNGPPLHDGEKEHEWERVITQIYELLNRTGF